MQVAGEVEGVVGSGAISFGVALRCESVPDEAVPAAVTPKPGWTRMPAMTAATPAPRPDSIHPI